MKAISVFSIVGFVRLVAFATGLGSLFACGTQINTLRAAAKVSTGAEGVPPALTSLAIVDTSPTRSAPLTLSWGVPVGSYTQYCLLENSQNANTCVWHSGALPATYSDSSADGSFTLTAFLKNGYGVSDPVDSNSIVIDRTPPNLASASITNADPTSNPSLGLNYGLITNGSYAEYCINTNNTSVAACSWSAGSVPSNVTIAAVDGSKTLSIWLRDAAGNVSNPVYAGPIVFDGTAPTVGISSPVAGTYVNAANVSSFAVSGTCSEDTRNVVISGAASATVVCSGGAWSANLDFSGAPAGAATINVNHADAAGNAAVQASRTFTKDATLPTVAISTPSAGAYVNASNVASFAVTGTCSEDTRNVVISGAASATVVCSGGLWSTNLDFTAAASGTVTINVNHSDAAGNAAVQASRNFTKDVAAPTLAISTPPAGSYVNAASVASFAVTGTCSENGRSVVISGSASASVVCSGGAWSANLDFSAAAPGTVTINVNHSDAAGNAAPTASRNFTKDVLAPSVAITSPPAGSVINNGNLTSFAVSGSCSENGQNVVLSGAVSATVPCTAGSWSTNLDFTAASDGPLTLYADLTDVAGNPAPQDSRNFTKTTGIPSLTISTPSAGAYVNAANVASFTVTGTCSESGQDVVITGSASQTVTCLAGGWTANLDFSAASAGPVSITVNHSDSGGNPANTQTRSFTKDVTAATVAISTPNAGAYVNAAEVASFPVTGTCSENGRNIVISGDATATVACAAGSWSANLDFSGAAAGTVSITVNHSDAAGNAAPPATRNFTKDVAAPTLAISTPNAGAYVNIGNVASFVVTGTCSENGQNVVITGDATATVACAGGAWSANLDFSAAGAGTVSIDVDHSDAAGNPAPTASRNFTKDVTAPTLAISTPNAGAYVNAANVASFAVTGTCSDNGQNVVITGDATATVACAGGAWSANLDFSGAAAGTVSITVNHSDAAGNAAPPATRNFTKDVTAATVAISTPNAGAYVNSSNVSGYSVTGTCSDNGQNVVITGDATATVSCTAGGWSASLNFSSAAAGAVSITVNHSDAAGNAAPPASRAFVKDVTPPVVAVVSPNGGESWAANVPKSITWTATDTGGTGVANTILIELSTNGGSSYSTVSSGETNDGSYTWSVPPTVSATARIRVTAIDAAGNSTSDASNANFSILKDLALTPTTFTAALTNSTTPIISSKIEHQSMLGDDGKVYIFGGGDDPGGGFTGNNSTPDVLAYDPATGFWKSMPPMRDSRENFKVEKLSDGRIWVGGGLSWSGGGYSYISHTEIFDPATGLWSRRKDLPETRYRFTVTRYTAADGKDRIALIGGKKDAATTRSNILIYDPAQDTWTTSSATMTTPRSDHAAVLLSDGRIWVGGGQNGGTELKTCGFYDPSADTWTNCSNSSASVHTFGDAALVKAADSGLAYDVVVLLGGGGGTGGTVQKTVDRFRVDNGTWSAGAAMATNRGRIQILEPGGGKLIVAGGFTGTATNSSSVEQYDVAANTWTAKASLPVGLGYHTATLLPSGNILVAGGDNTGQDDYIPKNYLFTAGSPGSWAETGHFLIQADNYASVKLSDGKILRCGGYSSHTGAVLKDCYEFDPSTNNWDTVGKMATARQNFTLTLLPSGDVLAAGGRTNNSTTVTNTAELYNHTTKTWSATGSFTGGRRYHRALLLQDNDTVLIMAGDQGSSGGSYRTTAQKYSIASGTWSDAGTMAANHGNFAVALLANGKVFVNGGFDGSTATKTTEIYDPATNTWSAGANSLYAHGTAAVSYYKNGATERVYLLSGWTSNGGGTLANSEYYDPSTDSWTSRASITAGQERYTWATVTTADGYVYLFGGVLGSVGGGSPTKTIYRYSISGNSWSSVTPALTNSGTDTLSMNDAQLLNDGRILIPGSSGTPSSSEIYSFVTTKTFVATGGDLLHTLSLFSGLGTFYPASGLYVPLYSDFSSRGGSGGTARIEVDDGSGNTAQSDVTIP
ncbi:MAG: hypothetical protein JST04_04495 [Bdellovibrionales bacterium]|nr:hypothetical protein [Bdellovibrionales bacterium]